MQDEEQLRLAVHKLAALQQQLDQAQADKASKSEEAEAQQQKLQEQALLLQQQLQVERAAAEQESSNARLGAPVLYLWRLMFAVTVHVPNPQYRVSLSRCCVCCSN